MTVTVPSLCDSCLHRFTPTTCAAYLGGIPEDMTAYLGDHHQPRVGDHGVQWALKPGTEAQLADWESVQ